MALRGIPEGLPETVFHEAEDHYADTETGTFVATKRLLFQGKERDMALSYRLIDDDVLFITLHPLKEGQKAQRVRSGRWILHEPECTL